MRVIGHRGDPKAHGDNNMESFRSARDLGVFGIEMDVCITKDNILVINHNNIDKQTGVPLYDRNYSDDTDLKFEKALLEFKYDKFEFVIDIKDTRVYSTICRDIYELCVKHGCLERCVLGSFNEFHMRDLRNLEKATKTPLKKAYITANVHEDLFSSSIEAFGITHLVIYKFLVNQQVVTNCHEKGVQVYTYTCNTLGLHDHMDSLGCDGIITDVPGSFIL